VFKPPKQKTLTIDIPGADGIEDLSTILLGYPTYSNREGSFEFIVMNGYKEWHALYSDIMDYLHGRTMKAFLEDDPLFYYQGRFTVNEWKSDPHNSKIVIDYSVEPYKLLKYSSVEDWAWDDLDFELNPDLFRIKEVEVSARWRLTVKNLSRTVVPKFTVSSNDNNGLEVTLKDDLGHNASHLFLDGNDLVSPNLRIYGSSTTIIEVHGYGTISVDFRMGRL
jgi:hypothetical protein